MDEQQNIIIYRTADGRASVALFAKDGKIWLNQQQMAELFATSKQLINHHIANILKENELNKISVVKQYLTTAAKFIFATSKTNISMHIANLLKEKELIENAVVKFFLTTAVDGKKNRGTRR